MIANKRGLFMGVYLVIITLFFCAISIGLYLHVGGDLARSLVSPEKVLTMEDSKNIFELNENKLINESFCAGGDVDTIKTKFCDDLFDYNGFFKRDLFYNQNKVSDNTFYDKNLWSNFCDLIYLFSLDGDDLSVNREILSKSFLLENNEVDKIKFDVTVNYVFDKSYSFDRDDC